MASLISSRSNRSDESQPFLKREMALGGHGAHMKINLPVFKDKDAKDTVTYQSWRWDLTVYQHVGCRDYTHLPYAIQCLQGYPGKLVQSSGTDITVDDVLTILDKYYNNSESIRHIESGVISVADGGQRNCIGLGCLPFKASPGSGCFLP